ncbi:MAG: argininosuccinate lyase [Acidobacteria bacterium]|nr:argininosuccinate lyase [Acidobacteriota bacterium]
MTRLWGGRFEGAPAPEMLAFTRSAGFDGRLAREDCAVLAVHARGLAAAGLLDEDQARQVAITLEGIAADLGSGRLAAAPDDEDVHSVVERALLERLPDVAPRVRAGLSRNDRVATALRLWLLREGRDVVGLLADLIEVLAQRAAESREVVLPGYTHLQRAQPVRLAHHLLAHAFALERDARRLLDAVGRADASPLGAGALAGSTLGLDPTAAAAALGLCSSMENSLDAVAARDFVAEFLAAAAILGVHCSRLGEELVLWTSEEFGFAALSDAWATGSSLMPQKKNPDVAELARAKAGRLIGHLAGFLATLKGLPLAYNRDLQEDKEPLFDAVDTLRLMLPALAGALRTLEFRSEAMAAAAERGALLATDLAEYLVRKGVPFRDAHEIVGRAVQRALAQGRALSDLSLEDLRSFSEAFQPDVRSTLSARASADQRPAPGPSSASVEGQLARLGRAVAELRAVVS